MNIIKKILIISSDPIQKKMAGPGIRYWNFAKYLSKEFNVVLASPGKSDVQAEFTIIESNKRNIKEHLAGSTTVIIQGMGLWKYPFIKKARVPIVIDLYDPFIFENIEMNYRHPNENALHKANLSVLLDQLMYGDYFICSSEKQKDFWLGMLATINRINPLEYQIDKTFNHLLGIVSFGLTEEKPIKTKNVIKGVHPGISSDDKIILWGGGVWDWLDPLTAIQAIRILSYDNSNIKLFFMGIKHPNSDILEMSMVKKAVELSDSLNLTNKFVFFNDWVTYEDRHNYYLEADVGLSLHFNTIETRMSFRTRILDYIWCQLPVISTNGDTFSEFINKHKIGEVVDSEDYKQLASTIKFVLNNKNNYNYKNIHDELIWENTLRPLVKYCKDPIISRGKNQVTNVNKYSFSKTYYYIIKTYALISDGKFKQILKKINQK